jgi:hypothetical protein
MIALAAMNLRPAVVALAALAVAPALGPGPAVAVEAVEVLTPDMVARLDPARERPLTLVASGDVARLMSGDGEWEEGAPPVPLDLDRDGVPDYVVFSIVDARSERRAVVIHHWGASDRDFGPAVFYLIVDPSEGIEEWGGQHRLTPRPGASPDPATPAASRPAP